MKTESQKMKNLELGTRILLAFGFLWIIAGGLVASWVGVQEVQAGNLLYGILSVMISAVVFLSAWLMKREMER